MAANAQFILGGQIGFNHRGGNVDVEKTLLVDEYSYPVTKNNDLTIAPTLSYVINEKMQVGLSIAYTNNAGTTYDPLVYAITDQESWVKTTTSSLGIVPYFRYYFATAGKFNFFCQADLGLTMTPRGKTHTYDDPTNTDTETEGTTKSNVIRLAITPGVNYKFNDKWSADMFIDLAGIEYSHRTSYLYAGDDLVSTTKTNNFGLTADASAQTIGAHFGNFRIGINYHF